MSAYGAASVKAAPDLVRIRLVVERMKPSPKKAFEAGQANVASLRGVLRRHDIPDAAVSASRLRLTSEWDGYGKEREFLGYKCEASFTIESRNLDGLQQLLIEVVDAGVNRVDEVDFDVHAKGELRAQARRAAVQAARAKALLYAEAAGVGLGPVLHIQDVDPESVGNERYRGHGAGGATAEEDLAPGHVVVSAAVVLGFSLAAQ
ncbi:SIMPL domain-containing protein [Nonomuraea sp. NEAU-A123]|uniref:SIMPL domain-containing protein n=1 Tax=Nonomuraea sp. NEAU-A123 TaxID=2839649 RepID=UPI001BE473F6|nr:SIMPL domain-containing protein [Nonomuraea sp. NEAU-A123]MBT2231637.1 SIMPL domain-containing protein [Nonomuraea sp. NEAU-A123]